MRRPKLSKPYTVEASIILKQPFYWSIPLNTSDSPSRPAIWDIFLTWLSLGLQSFGGGSTTFLLMHQTCTRRKWLTDEEFTRNWALSQISPGINLVKMTVMVGYQLRGWPGVFAAMSGMLIPSAAITVIMTAGFTAIRSQPLVQAALRGVLPATIGLSFAMAFQMAAPLLGQARREGPRRMGAHLFILAAAGLLLGVLNVSPVIVLLVSGAAGAGLLAVLPVTAASQE